MGNKAPVLIIAIVGLMLWWVFSESKHHPEVRSGELILTEAENKNVNTAPVKKPLKNTPLIEPEASAQEPKVTDQLLADIQDWIDRYQVENRFEYHNEGLAMFEAAHQKGNLEAMTTLLGQLHSWEYNLARPDQHVIGGDKVYIRFLSRYALRLLSCQTQPDQCEANKPYMDSYCQHDSAMCNLTFQQYLDVALTPGMKMDVEALMAYYSKHMD